ncbi:MAG TPA: hypothetical protein ENN45_04445 [Bacteroidetes bacterium]|nr:hypothetical protein [Bacteroidota bacterium]
MIKKFIAIMILAVALAVVFPVNAVTWIRPLINGTNITGTLNVFGDVYANNFYGNMNWANIIGAPDFVLKSGDTMTGNLTAPNFITSAGGLVFNTLESRWALKYADGLGIDNTGLYFNSGTGKAEYHYLGTPKIFFDVVNGNVEAEKFIGDGSELTGINESKWERTGTTLKPKTAGDNIETEAGGHIFSDGVVIAKGQRRTSVGFNDLLVTGGLHTTPWYFTNLAGGSTVIDIIYGKDHPGVFTHRTHVTNTNSGAQMYTSNVFLLGGGEYAEFAFYVVNSTDLLVYWGWHNTINHNAPTRGAYMKIVNATVMGETINNLGSSTTSSNYTLSPATWYRGVVEINSDVTLATFKIYSDAGVLLWGDALSSYLPDYNLNHTVGCNLVTVRTSGGTANYFIAIDYLYYYIDRELMR